MHPTEALSPTDVFGARAVAFVLDIGLVFISASFLSGSSGLLFAVVFYVVYMGIVQGLTGFTAAKAVLGLRVVKAGTTEKAGIGANLIRTIIGPLDVIAGLVLFIVNERRRRVGDLVGGTEVVGIGESSATRAIAGLSYFGLLSLFILLGSFNTFLILWAIFVPIFIGFAVVVLGQRRLPDAWPWLAGLAFTLPAAALMSFVSLCHRGEGHCRDIAASHKAIPALILLVIAIGVVFLVKGLAAHVAVAVLVAVSEIWMFLRMYNVEDAKIAAWLELILLAFALAMELVRRTARRRAAQLEALTAT